MKNLNTVLALFCLCSSIFFFSCDDDEVMSTPEEIVVDSVALEIAKQDSIANGQNASENRKIPVSELDKNVVVVGATKKTGTAPAPTGSVDFKLQGRNNRAQLKSGFNIKLESNDDDIAGAYLQLLDSDKNKVDGYFEVPISAFTSGRLNGKSKNNLGGLKTKELEENEIDINFGDGLQPGTFCYEICLYDADNNVSSIVEVCVEVESWGGNASLVGTWKLNEAESDLEANKSDNYYEYCDNGDSLLIEDIVIFENFTISFNNDGSYEEGGKVNFPNAIFSSEECSVSYEDDDSEKAFGKWSFDEDDQTLVVIAYEYIDEENPSNNEVLENGELYFENEKIDITGNKLTLTFEDDDDVLIYVFDKQ